MIPLAYISWLAASLVIFAMAPRRYAPWLCLLGGWLFLPPALYPSSSHSGFPFWIIGGSLPSDVLVSKAWVAPLATVLASLVFDWRRWLNSPLRIWDIPIAAFCLWPLIQHMIIGQSSPAGWVSSLYLAGTWALPWWLGRLYLSEEDDFRCLAFVLAAFTLLLLPIAILEGVSELRVHSLLFSEHPYATNGHERYIGYRPQAFFENGNQYGLWCAAAAVAAYWLVRRDTFSVAAVVVLIGMTVASQSAGAIVLMGFGILALTWSSAFSFVNKYALWLILAGILAGALVLTGLLPLRDFIMNNPVGQALLDAVRSTGRGSFAWRISQDMKAAPLLREHLILGHGTWDWFMAMKSRPWGFPLLVVGQLGLIGLTLLVLPIIRSLGVALAHAARGSETAKFVTVLILIAGFDALLNSFLFWPFIVLAAGFCGANQMAENEEASSSKAAVT